MVNGPESHHVVDAVDALLRGDAEGARSALSSAGAHVGWPAVSHRLEVVGRALTIDAGFDGDATPAEIDLVPSVLRSTIVDGGVDVSAVIDRWRSGGDAPDTASTVDDVWPSLAVVAWLVDAAGYPAEVVV